MSEIEQLPSRSVARLVATLGALGIEFAIVGGVAVSLVSTPRFTADVDAVLLDIDDRLEWLIDELKNAGYESRASDPIAFARRTRVLTMRDKNGVGIDLMLGLLPFDIDLVSRAVTATLSDLSTVPVASPTHLVVIKAIAWRPRDVEDIRQLVSVNPGVDWSSAVSTFAEYAELLEVPVVCPQL
jgi:Nucleotidyl transferase AbiEii toxin, Type IV TA system